MFYTFFSNANTKTYIQSLTSAQQDYNFPSEYISCRNSKYHTTYFSGVLRKHLANINVSS